MSVVLARAASVIFGAVAMLSLLLAVTSFAFGRADGVVFYALLSAASSYAVARLMRRDTRRRRALGELPQRRVPRRPIAFPIRETAVTFAFWYAVAVALDAIRSGALSVFTLVAIAPFAAFVLATLTIAGRHMAFRLTAEEDETPGG